MTHLFCANIVYLFSKSINTSEKSIFVEESPDN